jgi:hypothetical protein
MRLFADQTSRFRPMDRNAIGHSKVPNRRLPALFAVVLTGFLPACGVLPGTGPTSDAVNSSATA